MSVFLFRSTLKKRLVAFCLYTGGADFCRATRSHGETTINYKLETKSTRFSDLQPLAQKIYRRYVGDSQATRRKSQHRLTKQSCLLRAPVRMRKITAAGSDVRMIIFSPEHQ